METDRVNLQLWTIPLELECYMAITAAAFLGLYKHSARLFLLLLAVTVTVFAFNAAIGGWPELDSRPPGRMVVLCFLWGVLIYRVRAIIPYSWALFTAAVALAWISSAYAQTAYLAPLPIAYVTVFMGLQDPRRIWLLRGADYSYGVYLYGFPCSRALPISYRVTGYGGLT